MLGFRRLFPSVELVSSLPSYPQKWPTSLFYRSCRVAPLIQCDYCPLLFHMDCLEPPLTAMPLGRWMCPNHIEHVVVSTAVALQSSPGTAGACTGSVESVVSSFAPEFTIMSQVWVSADQPAQFQQFDVPQLCILPFLTVLVLAAHTDLTLQHFVVRE